MSKLYKKPSFIGLTDKLMKPDFLDINIEEPEPDPDPDPIGDTSETEPVPGGGWINEP